MATTGGVIRAVEVAQAGRSEGPGRPAEQLSLLPAEPGQPHDGNLGGSVRGVGRPRGSKNRRTEEWTEYLVRAYGSPLEALARLYAANTEELAKRLGCTIPAAAQEQRLAAIAALPYLHQRQPLAINVDASREVMLTIIESGAVVQVDLGGDLVTILDYQEVSDGDDGEVGQTELDKNG